MYSTRQVEITPLSYPITMEANVSLQHAPEKWAPGEGRHEQPGKVTYIFGARKRDKELQVSGTGYVKPSRSYDNELKASAETDTQVRSKLGPSNVRDDLSLSFGERAERYAHAQEGRATQPHIQFAAHSGLEQRRGHTDESRFDDGVSGSYSKKHDRWKPKSKSREKVLHHKSRHGHAADPFHTSSQLAQQNDSALLDSKIRPIPVEFHLKEDQFQMSGPTVQCKRPITLSSPFSSLSSSRDKPSSLVILEVKDGPTFFYKPSHRMISDTGFGDETVAPPQRGCFPQTEAGQASSGVTDSASREPTRIYSTISSSVAISKESSHFSAVRRDSSTSLQLRGSGCTEASTEGSPKTRNVLSQLPRTPGLRKPDLSVLTTPPRNRANLPSDDVSGRRGGPTGEPVHDNHNLTSQSQEHVLTPPNPASVTPLVSVEASASNMQRPFLSEQKQGTKADTSLTEPKDAVAASSSYAPGLPLPPPMTDTTQDPSCGFQNTSELLQQKAGIKHDDIVVGPRRPRSGVHQYDVAGIPESKFGFVKHDFLEANLAKTVSKGHSLSSDGLSGGHERLSQKGAGHRRRHGNSESETFVVWGSSEGGRSEFSAHKTKQNSEHKTKQNSEHKTKQNSEHKPSVKDKSHSVDSHSLFLEQTASPPAIAKSHKVPCASETGSSMSESGRHWRPRDRRTGISSIQRPQQNKKDEQKTKMTSYTDLAKSELTDPELRADSATYKSKSLDRKYKPVGETKLTSNSAHASPAKHQQHSPKSKSCTSTPSKKLANPKLHMLSNIPVPISHDPPAKRHSVQRPPSTPSQAETRVPSPSEQVRVATSSKSPNDRIVPQVESAENISKSSLPPLNSLSCGHSSVKAPSISAVQDSQCSAYQTQQPPASVPCGGNRDVVNEGNGKASPLTSTGKSDNTTTTSAQPDLSITLPSAGTVVSVPEEPATESPGLVPVKPRLHRSAEHLVGDTKLTVFNSAENVKHFENPEPSSSARSCQDSAKSEKAGGDSISPLKKNHGLAKIGIMRRGSDRTEMCRRGSERAVLAVDQNDPSVEDLKKATSLQELCQSMASLLNIDNVKAAEMITTSLSQRQDLVDGLDADAILDYLSHHGVLDTTILVGLDDKATIAQRNSAILRHVEEHGNTAVALFINALRQSGQLHLASSLDTEQRIKPVSGNGYFGKDRHKGELTIRVEIESLKILAPREPRHEKIVDASLLGSPARNSGDDAGVVIKDAADDDDVVKPRSCWCFCFSRKNKTKSASKKDVDKQKQGDSNRSSSVDKEPKPLAEESKKDQNVKHHRAKSQDKTKKLKESSNKAAVTESTKKDMKNKEKESGKKSKSSKSKSKVSGKSSAPTKTDTSSPDQALNVKPAPELAPQLGSQEPATKERKWRHGKQRATNGELDTSVKMVGLRQPVPQQLHHQPYNGVTDSNSSTTPGPKPDKEAWDPIIMEYDPKLELIKLRAGQDELASPTRQSGNIGIMCEQWKSNGRHFQQKALQLCERIIQELQTEIIKYFEQDRGTLVLDVASDGSAILIINICMKRAQVKCLQQEIADESLVNKMEDMFFSRVDIAEFDIRGVKLRIVLDEQEVLIVLSELS